MKLKRIIAGITACTIVGSTMLTMPISARTTTKVENGSKSERRFDSREAGRNT